MFSEEILHLAKTVIEALAKNHQNVVTAESCTGGLVAAALTAIPGSSEVVHGGFVTYANAAKEKMLGVPKNLLIEFGAVSKPVALVMAEGALSKSGAFVSIAVTGVAGPGGGSRDKPVGLVHFACATLHKTLHMEMRFGDLGRDTIRQISVITALELVSETLVADQA